MNVKTFLQRLGLTLVFCAITALFFFIAYKLREKLSPAYQTKKALVNEQSRVWHALFAPDDNVQDILLTLIHEEKDQILAAAYSFTDGDIAHALLQAHMRGVHIEAIFDGSNSITPYSKVSLLIKGGIPTWIYPSVKSEKNQNPVGIMHNKFMIFTKTIDDRSLLWTGSFNFTRSAQSRNQENVIITDEKTMIKEYRQQFETIKQRCIKSN